jgi:hypothetical protein
MKQHFSSLAAVFCFLLIVVMIAFAGPQEQLSGAKPVVFKTAPRPIQGQWTARGATNSIPLRATASLTLASANEDDTVTGTLTLTLPDGERRKIAERSGQPLQHFPASILKPDVTAAFRRGASCPSVRLELNDAEWEVAGGTLRTGRLALDIIETPDPIPQLFCSWTRQLNTRRPWGGIIAAINRLISSDPTGQ